MGVGPPEEVVDVGRQHAGEVPVVNEDVEVGIPSPPALAAEVERQTAGAIDDVSGMPAPGSAGNPTNGYTPAGTYTMVIEKRWIQVRQPGHFDKLGSDGPSS